MSTKKATKRALLTSILAICLCLVMLVGSTFAWFTDTASTGVNRIESGKLDVALEMFDTAQNKWVNAEGKTLDFVKAQEGAGEEILWEPGCRYKLPELRVVNNGNLDLKYKIEISGIKGDAKLLEVIDWTIGGQPINLTEQTLLAGKASDSFTIQGEMQKTANNDYQNKSITGIAITVYATQMASEFDSFDNTYDANATYPLAVVPEIKAELTKAEGATDYTYTDGTVTVTLPADAVADANVNPTISIVPTNKPADLQIADADKATVAYEISVTGKKDEGVVSFKLFIGTGLTGVQVYHKGNSAAIESTYDQQTGFVTFSSAEFSPFTIAFDARTAMVNGVAYDSLLDAVAAANNGGTVVLCKSEALALNNTEPMTISNVTFKSASGVVINGMKLIATSTKNMVTLENVKFEGITFTDRVVLGQDTASYGLSKCNNITFDGCKFDLSTSTEEYPDAIKRMGVSVSGTISEKEAVAYMDGLTVKNCAFTNVRYGVFAGKVRNTTVENCTFTNCSSYAVRFEDVAGKLNVIGNTVNKAGGVLTINTVGNNYSTTDIQTDVTIKNNTATDMTCGNGNVFMTTFDNARQSGKSTYTITGNSCTYTQSFDAPLCGFRIKNNYGPSRAEFINQ